MSSAGNHQSSGQQGEPNSNTSSVRVLPTRNISAASAPSHFTGENVSAGIQSGVSSAVTEQATNTVATSAPEERSSLPDLSSERSTSIVCLFCNLIISCSLHLCPITNLQFLNQGERGKEHCEDLRRPEVDTSGDAKLTKKTTPEVVTPLGLGLGGLDRKVMNEFCCQCMPIDKKCWFLVPNAYSRSMFCFFFWLKETKQAA